MAAAYSMDLRERVLRAFERIGDADDVAEQLQVSRSWVHRIVQRQRETGSVAPKQQTKFRARKLAGQEERLRHLVNAAPDATLAELREQLGVAVGLSTVWTELARLGLTLKKNGTRHRTAAR